MANYTTPLTVVPGAAALASDWNTYVRDNTINLNDRVASLETNITITALTQAEYDLIVTPDSNVLYVIVPA